MVEFRLSYFWTLKTRPMVQISGVILNLEKPLTGWSSDKIRYTLNLQEAFWPAIPFMAPACPTEAGSQHQISILLILSDKLFRLCPGKTQYSLHQILYPIQ
jgi:hypothetical protein